MGIREEQKEKRRKDILLAGLEIFIRKGYSATKISDIAEQVGMSVGLLFHYFDSKEALYEELISIGISGPMSVLDDTGMEPFVFFENTANQMFQFILKDPFNLKMFTLMNQAFYNEAAPQSIKEKLQSFDVYTPTIQIIQKGQDNGTIREGNPYALAIAFWCAIQGIAEQIALKPDIPYPESEWIIDIIRRK
ncbi:TetR/AcrR family transcriptional regulator [Anaerosacchariphilus polymeriproducens]|uniref:TetR/AcrR family transcriptional regulator n=1 Tax=Anaerosacchariphilus polymeriproducens TaxID=1812858 RepID=A0A371AX13_9FIRM|nr:TetR/AcrR family transcriptional regulator [Anaerosacchariphilus polymeriproducens]RDU24118.1 TetR/AcrR family transcriptional regulator [Anaerosacchariphilus polymeriproducens]